MLPEFIFLFLSLFCLHFTCILLYELFFSVFKLFVNILSLLLLFLFMNYLLFILFLLIFFYFYLSIFFILNIIQLILAYLNLFVVIFYYLLLFRSYSSCMNSCFRNYGFFPPHEYHCFIISLFFIQFNCLCIFMGI